MIMNLDRVIAVRNSKTIYRDGDKSIKVFNSEYSKADVLNEALNQARIEELELNIPKILEVTTVDGKWAIVYEHIKGKTLDRLMVENPEKKDEYIALLVDLQMSVHEKRCPLLNSLKDKLKREIAESDLEATTRYDLHIRLEEQPNHNKVCHGDFIPSNIIVTDDGVPYIIDWSHAAKGNATADIARTYLLLKLKGDSDGAKKYLELFCRKSNVEKEAVQKWLPVIAAAQSVKAREEDRNTLISWVDKLDLE